MPTSSPVSATQSIAAFEDESVVILPGSATAGLVLLCDHAGNALPDGYGTLGLDTRELGRHIAYDIGAAEVTCALSRSLGVPAVLSRFSRLLIDINRGLDDPTLVMRISDGAVVPGNRHLDTAERERRIGRYYLPYHRAVTDVLDRCQVAGVPPAILSVHSFTDHWKGEPRPWHVGILFDSDDRMARPLIDALWREGDLVVGENEPYRGPLEGDTLWQHGLERGLKHVLIELRQDLIGDSDGQRAWSERLTRILVRLATTLEINLQDMPDLKERTS